MGWGISKGSPQALGTPTLQPTGLYKTAYIKLQNDDAHWNTPHHTHRRGLLGLLHPTAPPGSLLTRGAAHAAVRLFTQGSEPSADLDDTQVPGP